MLTLCLLDGQADIVDFILNTVSLKQHHFSALITMKDDLQQQWDIHCVSKNVPPLACYNFGTHEWILTFFGRNVTVKIGNQKTLYYTTLSNLCFCTTWQNGETRKSHFHSVGLCYTYNAAVRCLPERKSCHL